MKLLFRNTKIVSYKEKQRNNNNKNQASCYLWVERGVYEQEKAIRLLGDFWGAVLFLI